MKTELGETKIAYFDGHEWFEIDYSYQSFILDVHELGKSVEWNSIVELTSNLSKRSVFLHGIFVNAYCIGNVILDKPHILFLHGVRYDRENRFVSIETIIDNAKAGI